MANYGSCKGFDSEQYLATRCSDVNNRERIVFPLEMLHKEFSLLPNSLKVLDYGSGPVIMTVISAAAKAADIVLADYSSSNRATLRSWLDNDPTAFNWTPFFEYVVLNLEGKNPDEVAPREAAVRDKVKNVVSADINNSLRIIEEGFEGPYDVISSSCCLESSCSKREAFESNLKKLSALLRPGGRLMLYLTERKMDRESGFYYIGSQKHAIVSVNAEYVADLLRSIGFSDVRCSTCRPTDLTLLHTFQDESILGYMFVSGEKGRN